MMECVPSPLIFNSFFCCGWSFLTVGAILIINFLGSFLSVETIHMKCTYHFQTLETLSLTRIENLLGNVPFCNLEIRLFPYTISMSIKLQAICSRTIAIQS